MSWPLFYVASGAGAVASNLDRTNSEIVRLWWETEGPTRSMRQYRRFRKLTDLLLDYLERLNMRFPQGRRLDETTTKAIEEVLAELPDPQLVQTVIAVPMNTTYWTNWPSAQNYYIHEGFWHRTAALQVQGLQPVVA